jgi:hypothetical protein
MKANAENTVQENSNAAANSHEKELAIQPNVLKLPAVLPYPGSKSLAQPVQRVNKLSSIQKQGALPLSLPAVPVSFHQAPPIQMKNKLTMHGEKAGSGHQQENDDDEEVDTGREVANTINSGHLVNIRDSHDALERSIAVREEEVRRYIEIRDARGQASAEETKIAEGHQIRIRLERGWLQQFKDAITRSENKIAAKQKEKQEEETRVDDAHDTDKNPSLGEYYKEK